MASGFSRKVCYHTAGLSDPIDSAVTTTDSLAGETFARLFEAVHEGVYIGLVDARGSSTLFANPFLKLMFGFAADTPSGEVRPFEIDLFVDP